MIYIDIYLYILVIYIYIYIEYKYILYICIYIYVCIYICGLAIPVYYLLSLYIVQMCVLIYIYISTHICQSTQTSRLTSHLVLKMTEPTPHSHQKRTFCTISRNGKVTKVFLRKNKYSVNWPYQKMVAIEFDTTVFETSVSVSFLNIEVITSPA